MTIPNVGGFDSAQRHYEAQMPPEHPPCRYCDDQGELEVAALYDVDGKPQEVPARYSHMAPCPWCPLEPMKRGVSDDRYDAAHPESEHDGGLGSGEWMGPWENR